MGEYCGGRAAAGRRSVWGVLAVLAVVATFAVATRLATTAFRAGRLPGAAAGSLAAPSTSGDGWTFKELAGHLRQQGLPVKMRGDGSGDVYFYEPRIADAVESGLFDPGSLQESVFGHDGVVHATRHPSHESARQYAGRHDRGAFQWGIWVFTGTEATLKAYRDRLR